MDAVAVRHVADGSLETEAKRTAGGSARVGLGMAPDAVGGAYVAGFPGDIGFEMDAILCRLPR